MDIEYQQVILQEIADAIRYAKPEAALPMSVRVTPINMTSNTVPAPFVASSSPWWADGGTDRGPWHAFSNVIGQNGWLSADAPCQAIGPNSPVWIQIDLGRRYVARTLRLTTRRGNFVTVPRDFDLLGSDDCENWTTIFSVVGNPRVGGTAGAPNSLAQTWNFENREAYSCYRINFTHFNSSPADNFIRCSIGRMELLGFAASIQANDFATHLAAIPTANSAAFAEPSMAGRSLRAKFTRMADIIRAKLGISAPMQPSEMPEYIRQMR